MNTEHNASKPVEGKEQSVIKECFAGRFSLFLDYLSVHADNERRSDKDHADPFGKCGTVSTDSDAVHKRNQHAAKHQNKVIGGNVAYGKCCKSKNGASDIDDGKDERKNAYKSTGQTN